MREGVVRKTFWGVSRVLPLVMATVLGSGCAYLKNRGNDATDFLELGFTVSQKPGVAVFTDCYSVIPIGYSNVNGKIIGFGNRQIGVLDFEHKTWGVLARGSYKQGLGVFDPRDPHVARKDQAKDKPWPRFDMGVAGLIIGKSWRPFPAFYECDKSFHLGWAGIHLKYRWLDLLDFLVGWTTVDFMGDDLVRETPKAVPATRDAQKKTRPK
jgi:hypothetical protein